jgi:hypothetical protein
MQSESCSLNQVEFVSRAVTILIVMIPVTFHRCGSWLQWRWDAYITWLAITRTLMLIEDHRAKWATLGIAPAWPPWPPGVVQFCRMATTGDADGIPVISNDSEDIKWCSSCTMFMIYVHDFFTVSLVSILLISDTWNVLNCRRSWLCQTT